VQVGQLGDEAHHPSGDAARQEKEGIMTGTIIHRGKNRWALVFDLGAVAQPDGTKKRKQKWVTFHATATLTRAKQRKEAEAKLAELVAAQRTGAYVEPSKLTVIAYLRGWLEVSVKPMRRPATYVTYRNAIETHIAKAPIASILLQRLRGSHIEKYYAESTTSASSLSIHHSIFSKSMRKAVKDKLLTVTPVVDLERKKSEKDPAMEARVNCWSAAEARKVIAVAKARGDQLGVFTLLALDSGARRAELAGLSWQHLDLDAGTLTIERQLDGERRLDGGKVPVFGPTKTKRTRVITLGAETVAALRAHKVRQAELKMKNRTAYQDHGLLFAKEEINRVRPEDALGQATLTLASYPFHRLVTEAGVKRITFHGCRHTVATVSLAAGVAGADVAARLGHSVATLLKVYAHATPASQQVAASKLAAVLYG
jgi:integrase